MSSPNNNNNQHTAGNPSPARPEFRSARMQSRTDGGASLQQSALPTRKPPPAAQPANEDIIDMNDFKPGAKPAPTAPPASPPMKSNWIPTDPRPVPAFYPLEKSTRLVEDESPLEVAARISECLRCLSVQADYNNEAATASLLTGENVEMQLSLWKTPSTAKQDGVLVELQRRKGDSIVFHRYARHILDAAVGDFVTEEISPYHMENTKYSKKVQRLMATELKNEENEEHENAIIALEIAHGLMMKDRFDARQLGLESLCLLTDPGKTGYLTAFLASHVVLVGSTAGISVPGEEKEAIMMDEGPFQEIRETILSLVQFSRIGEDDVDDEVTSPESEQMARLHNLALAVLANALDVVEHPERFDLDSGKTDPENSKPKAQLRRSNPSEMSMAFLDGGEEFTNKSILSTLVNELGQAKSKPHNASLSAKCIGSLIRASEEAKRKAKELGAKTIVQTAIDVGCKTHLKLQTESQKVMNALTGVRSDQEQS